MTSSAARLFKILRPCLGAAIVLMAMFSVTSGLSAARLGLIVGSNYKGNSAGIPPLDLCEADAKLMKKTIQTHGRFDHVEVLLGRMVSAARVEKAVDALAKKAGPNDTVVLYFSGHGTYQRDSTAPNGLRNYIVMYDRPHVPDNIMNDWVKKIPTAKLVWIFDCCYSGGIAKKGRKSRGQGNVPIDEDQAGKIIENGDESIYFNNRAIIASSDANETSIEIRGGINHGIFTYYFAQGLQVKNGDLNKDGTVTAYEAFEWSKKRVIKAARKYNHRQTPQISGKASGILLAGKSDPQPPEPVRPDPQPQPIDEPDEPEPQPGPGPSDIEDPVTPEEPEVVEHEDDSKAVIITTILRNIQAGPTPMDPMTLIQRRRRGNDDRRIAVEFSGNEYDTKITWLNESALKRLTGETIPLGWYSYNGKRYRNQVAMIEVKGVPTGVHPVVIKADGYPVIDERLGVEKDSRNNKLFVVASLSGFGTIRGKVFYKNFDTPLGGQTIWMPTVKQTNQVHKMKSMRDGSFWFLNLSQGSDYFIKASFLESLPLDNKYFTVESGKTTKLDIVLNRRTLLKRK
ncbi:MAG: caspase family protein [bacterium]|nr:caspase family protein [bacterium]